MKRVAFAALAWLALVSPAAALERGDLVGAWTTQWANQAREPVSGAGAMIIRPDESPDALDGVSPAPGWDGVFTGAVEPGPDGSLIWSGRWASIWPEGATMGTFRFVFTSANAFTGIWSTDDGAVQNAAYHGRRAE